MIRLTKSQTLAKSSLVTYISNNIYTKISSQQFLQKKIFTERLNLKISNTGKVNRL